MMSALTCQPKCKREDCDNLVSKLARKKNGRVWQTYCCPSCQFPKSTGLFKNLNILPIAPKCANDLCNKNTNRRCRTGEGWNKYCCIQCQLSSTENLLLTKQTNLLRYGNETASKSDAIKAKITSTVTDIWDNRSTEDRLSVFKSSQLGLSKRKEYKFTSGKIISVRGYEPQALTELLSGYSENDIIAGNEMSITIPYVRNSKNHKYYPDIFIPKDNLIIEVKSKWTYSGKPEWLETNLLKQQATLDAGYNFRFMIY
jgi:hypothetical protein